MDFACLSRSWMGDGRMLRTSFHPTLEAAKNHAADNLGILAIEQLGLGIVWKRGDAAEN